MNYGGPCEADKLPWWVWETARWGGMTTVAPFWRPVHLINTFTQLRGWYWKKRGY